MSSCPHQREAWLSYKTGKLTFDCRCAKSNSHMWISCGKCFVCRRAKAHEWGVRVQHEMSKYSCSSWATLTYDDEHLVHSDIDQNGELCYHDIQLFIARLRKAGFVFRYICAGEYGSRTRRPHYHIIFFGFVITREIIRKYWHEGCIDDSEPIVKGASVGCYVAGYTTKKICAGSFPHRIPEMMHASQGIGKKWLLDHLDIFQDGFIRLMNNRTAPIPRYYWKVFSDIDPLSYEVYHDELLAYAADQPPPDLPALQARSDRLQFIAESRLKAS